MSRTIIGVDIDLHRIHAVASTGEVIQVNDPSFTPLLDAMMNSQLTRSANTPKPLVLIESASPHQYGGRLFKKKLSWMIYNSAVMASIASALQLMEDIEVRVSPSSTWTKGFPELVRHKMSGADQLFTDRNKEDAHNLRECLAMIWFYRKNPDNWVSVPEFLRDL